MAPHPDQVMLALLEGQLAHVNAMLSGARTSMQFGLSTFSVITSLEAERDMLLRKRRSIVTRNPQAPGPLDGMRYLSPHGKVQELANWERAKAAYLAAPPTGFHGGMGYPDQAIFGWVDRLNAIDGICTLQSCSGHRCTLDLHCSWCERTYCGVEDELHNWPATPANEHVISGQLWLWPDAIIAGQFHNAAPRLAAHPLIEKVQVIYHVDGKEIIDVQFRGAGTGELDQSMGVIGDFLVELSS